MSKATFSIEGDDNKYIIPLDLTEVTLKQYIDYCNLEAKHLPKEFKQLRKLYSDLKEIPPNDKLDRQPVEDEIKKLEKQIDLPEYQEVILNWFAITVEFWTGLPYNKIMGLDGGGGMYISQLKALFYQLEKLLIPPIEAEYSNVIEFNGEVWYLPSKGFKEATTAEYLEASHFQNLADDLAGNQWGVMPQILAIIVRKKDEPYTSNLVAERQEMFLQWTMDKVYQVAFFLLTRMEKLSVVSRTYTAAQTLSKLRQESSV